MGHSPLSLWERGYSDCAESCELWPHWVELLISLNERPVSVILKAVVNEGIVVERGQRIRLLWWRKLETSFS